MTAAPVDIDTKLRRRDMKCAKLVARPDTKPFNEVFQDIRCKESLSACGQEVELILSEGVHQRCHATVSHAKACYFVLKLRPKFIHGMIEIALKMHGQASM
jgi:hypothetical protein